MYTFESRVRYSEIGWVWEAFPGGNYELLSGLFHLPVRGFGNGYFLLKMRKKRAWWLNSWQILVDRQPLFGERIRISTWPRGFKGIYGYRNFMITDLEDNALVRADSCWFFYDLEHSVPGTGDAGGDSRVRRAGGGFGAASGTQKNRAAGGLHGRCSGDRGQASSRHESSCEQCTVRVDCQRASAGEILHWRGEGRV